MDFNGIGYFQFNNLIEIRVPMILINLENVDIKPWYNKMTGMYLDQITLHCSPDDVVSKVKQTKCPSHMSITVLDSEGTLAPQVVQELEKNGFINAYYAKGGLKGLAQERA